MILVDSHCHLNMLDLNAYHGNLASLINYTHSTGVQTILCVSVDMTHVQEVISIAEQFPGVFASVGIHPSEKLVEEISIEQLVSLAKHSKVIAIGETGLDYYYHPENTAQQQDRFRRHIAVAKELSKPLIIHTRDAREDTIKILREEHAEQVGGVMHCFTETWEMAEQALELGFYISFSGIVTFKNAMQVAEVATKVPLERILIETDAPYLTPVPHRGKKPNEPQYVRFVAEKIAELKQTSLEKVAEQTTANFFKLFQSCHGGAGR